MTPFQFKFAIFIQVKQNVLELLEASSRVWSLIEYGFLNSTNPSGGSSWGSKAIPLELTASHGLSVLITRPLPVTIKSLLYLYLLLVSVIALF